MAETSPIRRIQWENAESQEPSKDRRFIVEEDRTIEEAWTLNGLTHARDRALERVAHYQAEADKWQALLDEARTTLGVDETPAPEKTP